MLLRAGNLEKIIRPENAKGERLSMVYKYDNVVHTYPTNVSNSYGYSSEAQYDFKFGQMLMSKDLNGNEITYELDARRVQYITGPYEIGSGNKTIEFVYHQEFFYGPIGEVVKNIRTVVIPQHDEQTYPQMNMWVSRGPATQLLHFVAAMISLFAHIP